jgi:membrane-associated phospholipid phosphatase
MYQRPIIIIILLLACGIVLSLAAYFFGIFPFDLKVAHWLQGEENPVVFMLMSAVSLLGDWWVPLILVIIVAAFCASRNKWIEGVFVIATLSSIVIAGVLKMVIGRPRPSGLSLYPLEILQSFNQYSYPSGHVLFFVVFFGFLAFLAWKHFSGWIRWITISSSIVLVMLIGPSRLYLGDHWLSDVIGSYIIGTLWLIILILLYLVVIHRHSTIK